MGRRDPQPVERARDLLAAVEATGAQAFVADTAPIIYRVERTARRALVTACDPLFDAVAAGRLSCLVSAISVAELFIRPAAAGPAAVATMETFFQEPAVEIAAVDYETARAAAGLVAEVPRLADAVIASTSLRLGVPIVTGDKRLARAVPGALLIGDFV
jgi:predicted nucleic acid-binding protein